MSEVAGTGSETTDAETGGTAARPVPFRGGGFTKGSVRFVGLIVFVGLIAFWEFGSRAGFISQLVLPAPSEALEALRHLAVSGQLWKHLGASLYRLVIGYIAVFGTAPLVLWMILSRNQDQLKSTT